jgi:hypothetical protein
MSSFVYTRARWPSTVLTVTKKGLCDLALGPALCRQAADPHFARGESVDAGSLSKSQKRFREPAA